MNELEEIKRILKKLEKQLYGLNYEVHLQLQQLTDSTSLELGLKVFSEEMKLKDKVFPEEISGDDFLSELLGKLSYSGEKGSHGPYFSLGRKEKFLQLWNKLEQLLKQEFNPDQTRLFRVTNSDDWVFWSFCFILISKERNKMYLFEGGASD